MELATHIKEELLLCKICFMHFSKDKLPKMLLCSHTFCEQCLVSAIKKELPSSVAKAKSPGSYIPCPMCRQKTTLQDEGVQALLNNFTVLNLMDMVGTLCQGDGTECSDDEEILGAMAPKTETQNPKPSAFVSPTPCDETDRCAQCCKKYPESQFFCGHCICDKCLRWFLATNNDPSACPACAAESNRKKEKSPSRSGIKEMTPPRYGSKEMTPPRTATRGMTPPRAGLKEMTPPRIQRDYTKEMTPPRPEARRLSPEKSGPSNNENINRQPLPLTSDQCIRGTSPGRDSSQWRDCRPKECASNRVLQEIPAESNGDSKKVPSAQPPKPVPRISTLPRSKSPSPMSYESPSDANIHTKSATERPPPYNPTFLQPPEPEPRRSSLSSPIESTQRILPPIPRKRSISPVINRTPPPGVSESPSKDADNVSLGSIHSEISPSSSFPETSPLARTQSMRQPPPLPKRKYGTLPRSHKPRPSVQGLFANTSHQDLTSIHTSQPTLCQGEGESAFNRPSAPAGVTTPPVPPPRKIFPNPRSTVKCVKKFGNYSECSMQTSCFRRPSRVGLSERGDIVVVDTDTMTIQVFTKAGDYLSMFKVLGVQDASFITTDKICVASHRGIHIHSVSGSLITEMLVGQTVATASFKFGFAAATPKTLLIYRQSFSLVKEISRWKIPTPTKKWSPMQKKKIQMQFQHIRDITVTPAKLIAILDTGANSIVLMDEGGLNVIVIELTNLTCGNLKQPESIAADRNGNFCVADTENHRVLKLINNGTSVQTIVSYRGRDPTAKRVFPHGVAVTETDHLIVALSGPQIAEIRIYASNLS